MDRSDNIDTLCINTLRFLAVDAIEKAKSGHPGLPLGASPMIYVLWDRFLKHNPKNPSWINRDRFILSAGHGSALLYSLLHVYGYDLSLKELKRFRQWGSKTPGHPEYGLTPGVEATTGPLGQGFAMGVGMAIAEKFLANCFNQPDYQIINHYIYSVVSDGDLMEGISSEAASLAGTLGLHKLIYLYDDNHISIEGDTRLAFTENVQCRFKSFNWNIIRVPDGNNLADIDSALQKAQAETARPSLIMVRTHIGYGSPKQDSASAHGEPLGYKDVHATKKALDWPAETTFYTPKEALEHFAIAVERGIDQESKWQNLVNDYKEHKPEIFKQFDFFLKGKIPSFNLSIFNTSNGTIATRNASGQIMNVLNEKLHSKGETPLHFLIGGSADLSPSTKTILNGYGNFGFDSNCAHNLHFGVREHAMGAIANGIALHSNLIPYTATFLVFSDYMRPAIRLSALMKTHVIFIFTHDSIAMGEDGPTHQPVEHLMSLRAIPELTVIRPADANETAIAWKLAFEAKGPVILALTRQKLPILDLKRFQVEEGVPRGAYILIEPECECSPDIILIATGSEVHLALDSLEKLKRKEVLARVVSMPSWELFEKQDLEYKRHVLSPDVPKLALEAGSTLGWTRYVGDKGDVIGLDQFGRSSPGKTVYENLGFNVENVVRRVLDLLKS